MRKRKSDHVVLSHETAAIPVSPELRCRLQLNGASMKCQHCGEAFPMPVGLLQWVMAVSKAFTEAHAACKPKGSMC